MKRLLLIALAVLFCAPLNAGIRIAYNYFTVDNAELKFRIFSDSLYGARGDALRAGGTVSTLDFNQSFTSYNPAGLAFQKTPYAAFSGIPLEFASSDFVGFVINQDFGNVFADMSEGIIDGLIQGTSPGVYSDIQDSSMYIAQANGITGMEGVLPFAAGNASIAVGREEKFGMEMNVLAEGIKTNIDIYDPYVPGFAMNLTVTAGMAAGINLKSVVTSVGIGRKIYEQWGIGAVLEYVDTRMSVDVNAGANAVGSVGGNSFEYNTRPENSLEQYLTGDLSAAAWALRVGTSFHAPGDQAEVAIEFSIQPKFKFAGDMAGMAHTLPVDGQDIYDEFTLTGQTSTIENPWSSDDFDIRMKLPSYFRATLAWKPGPMVLAFNYTYGFDEMSISMESEELAISYDTHLQHSFRMGLNFEYFQIGAGIILSHENSRTENKVLHSGINSYAENIIPLASMGWVIPIGTNVKTEWELAALPFPVAKAAVVVNY